MQHFDRKHREMTIRTSTFVGMGFMRSECVNGQGSNDRNISHKAFREGWDG